MFSDFLKNLERHYKAGLPFVAYRKPNETLVKAIFQNNNVLHQVNDFKQEGFVFAPFDSNNPAVLLRADKIDASEFSNLGENRSSDFIFDHISTEAEKDTHIGLVKKGLNSIQLGNFKKVVLSRVIKAEIEIDPITVFQRLLTNYTSAFCYLWFHPKVGLWLGATPEKLLKLENGTISTNSLAGTQHYDGNMNPDWGRKEKEEQKLVTDYILNAIKDKVFDIVVSEVSTVKAGKLLHLKTSISGIANPILLHEIIEKLHPTPAVCGMPQETSKKFILENEDYDREFYTGFLGELNFTAEKERNQNRRNIESRAYRSIKKYSELFVNLRCVKISGSMANIYVGGGVTKDSNPKKEWEETIGKSQTMLNVLNSN